MNILLVSSEIWSEKNPEGIVCKKIYEGLISNGYSVDIVTNNELANYNANKTKVFVYKTKGNEIFSKLKKRLIGIEKSSFVKKVSKSIINGNLDVDKYDILITRSEPFFLHRIGFYLKDKNPRCKWIASFGDPVFINPYSKKNTLVSSFIKRLEFKIWSVADLVTHTNNRVLDEYKKHGFPIEKSTVLENPYCELAIDGASSSKKFKHNNEHIIFAYVGSLYGNRRIHPLLRFLCKQNYSWELKVIGGVRNVYSENRFGFINDFLKNKELKRLQEHIKEFNCDSNVEILPFMDKVSLNRYILSEVDVLVNVDAYDEKINMFLSSKIVEYLAFDKPILNVSVPGATVDFMASIGIDKYVRINGDDLTEPKDMNDILSLLPNAELIPKYSNSYITKKVINRVYLK